MIKKLIVILFLSTAVAWAQTASDLNLLTQMVQFLVGGPLTQAERQAIAADMSNDFRRDPASARQELNDIQALAQQMSGLSNPLEIGQVRQALLGALVAEYKGGYRSGTVDVVLNRIQPMAWDGNRQLVLTGQDFQGLVNYLGFVRGTPLSGREIGELQAQLVRDFSSLSDQEQVFVCNGSLVWNLVSANANRLGQQAVQQQYSATQDQQMDPAVYRQLARMSLENHASMMNVINNMGGSDDYWTVVDRPSW